MHNTNLNPTSYLNYIPFYTKFDFCTYSAEESLYMGKSCIKITVKIPTDDDSLSKIVNKAVDKEDTKQKQYLKNRILSTMEFWVDPSDTPFIYKTVYYNHYNKECLSTEWGDIEITSFDPLLFDLPKDVTIKTINDDDKFKVASQDIYQDQIQKYKTSQYHLSLLKIGIVILGILIAIIIISRIIIKKKMEELNIG